MSAIESDIDSVAVAEQLAESSLKLLSASQQAALAADASEQVAPLCTQLSDAVVRCSSLAQECRGSAETATGMSRDTLEHLLQAKDALQRVVAAAQTTQADVKSLSSMVVSIGKASDSVARVAAMTTLLALNAAIEAARAGAAGKGFAVVASEVRTLAHSASEASSQIKDLAIDAAALIERTSTSVNVMSNDSATADGAASQAAGSAHTASDLVGRSETGIREISRLLSDSEGTASDVRRLVGHSAILNQNLAASTDDSARKGLLAAERALRILIESGVDCTHARLHQQVMAASEQIEAQLEEALDTRMLDRMALFSTDRKLIPHTDPKQFTAAFDSVCDKVLPRVQDPLLADPQVAFAISFTLDGYVPTHNQKYSKPQRPGDRAWNLVNARTKRNFSEHAVLMSIVRSTDPYKVACYSRDTGETLFAIGAPLRVAGRHWGAFILAYNA